MLAVLSPYALRIPLVDASLALAPARHTYLLQHSLTSCLTLLDYN